MLMIVIRRCAFSKYAAIIVHGFECLGCYSHSVYRKFIEGLVRGCSLECHFRFSHILYVQESAAGAFGVKLWAIQLFTNSLWHNYYIW